jgi:hypothetical protein
VSKKRYKKVNGNKSNKLLSYPIFKAKFLSKSSNLYSITFLIAILKSGVWVFPAIYASFVISQQPFKQPFSNPSDQYLMTTWFASFFAHILGIKSLASFIVLHFVFAIFAVYLLFRYITNNVRQEVLGKSILLFAMLPAVSTVFYWVGMDSFTFLVMVTFLNFKRNPLVALIIGIVGGLHHFEILVTGITGLLVFEILRGFYKIKEKGNLSSIFFLLGVVLGKLLLTLIFAANHVFVAKGRTSIGLEGLKDNLDLVSRYGFLIYWSMLGVLWIVLIRAFAAKNRESFALLVSLLIPFAVVFFVRDSSRVIQLTSFLTIAVGLLSNQHFLEFISIKQIKLLLLAWLLVPWVWIWQGVFGTSILFTIKYVISRLFKNDLAPWTGSISMWPFT